MEKTNTFKKRLIDFLLHQNDAGLLLFFILLSFGLWLLMKFNAPGKDVQAIPLVYEIEGRTLPADFFGDTLHFDWTGSAWEQIKIRRQLKNYRPDLVSLKDKNPTQTVRAALQDLARGRIRWKDTGRLEVEKWQWRKIPVSVKGDWQTPPYYAVRDTLVRPDSVWVFVPAGHNFPRKIYTRPLQAGRLTGRVEKEAELDVPPGFKIFPSRVKVTLDARLFEEKTVRVPVKVPPAFEGRLMLMPPEVKVKFSKWIEGRSDDTPWIFEVPADSVGRSDKLPVRLVSKPASVFRLTYYPRKVDYIIMKKQ